MDSFWKTAGGFVLGFLTSVLAEPVRRWLFRAKLGIRFETVIEPGSKYLYLATGGESFVSYYIRGVIYNKSRFVAKDCRVYLTAIDKRVDDKGQFKRIHDQPFPLIWSYMDASPLDIPKKLEFLFDVLMFSDRVEFPFPQTKPIAQSWGHLLKEDGWYRYTILACGENCGFATITIQLQWQKENVEFPKNCFAIVSSP